MVLVMVVVTCKHHVSELKRFAELSHVECCNNTPTSSRRTGDWEEVREHGVKYNKCQKSNYTTEDKDDDDEKKK